jgi:hypothetical protein
MALLNVVPSQVVPGISCAINRAHLAGAAITIGQVVCVDQNGLWQLAIATTPETCSGKLGIAMSETLAEKQPLSVATFGIVVFGATNFVGGGAVTRQAVLVVSGSTPGGICLQTDLSSGNYLTQIGFWTGNGDNTGITNGIMLNLAPTGIIM